LVPAKLWDPTLPENKQANKQTKKTTEKWAGVWLSGGATQVQGSEFKPNTLTNILNNNTRTINLNKQTNKSHKNTSLNPSKQPTNQQNCFLWYLILQGPYVRIRTVPHNTMVAVEKPFWNPILVTNEEGVRRTKAVPTFLPTFLASFCALLSVCSISLSSFSPSYFSFPSPPPFFSNHPFPVSIPAYN
jgi:hypothetical protein